MSKPKTPEYSSNRSKETSCVSAKVFYNLFLLCHLQDLQSWALEVNLVKLPHAMALSMTQARWVTYERRMARSSASKCFEKCRTLLYLQDYIQKNKTKQTKEKHLSWWWKNVLRNLLKERVFLRSSFLRIPIMLFLLKSNWVDSVAPPRGGGVSPE